MKEKENKTFPFGANYYPLFHTENDLIEDFRKMDEAGFNHVRTGELLCSWDRVEIKEGKYDWSWMDRLLEEAEKHKFMVMLGTGSASPPYWLYKKYPDIRIVSREGIPHPMRSTWNWACRHHPGFKKEVKRYITELVKRYREHPALFAWQINNEPGFPFIEINNSARIYCYCKHTANAFRNYLKERFATIEEINEKWKWLATNQAYTDWDEIEPPEALPSEWGSVASWLDWRRFLDKDLADYIKWEKDILNDLDNIHPKITNTFVITKHDYFGVTMGLDAWKFSEILDAIGFDLYPGIANRFKEEPEYISYFLYLAKSISKNKPMWIPELQSGPIGGWSAGPEHNAKAKDIARFTAEVIGHGAKEILFQGWREWKPQPMHWGGMVDLEGNKTQIVNAVSEIAKICIKYSNFLQNAEPERHGIGILYSKDNAIILYGTGHQAFLEKETRGLINLLWEAGYYIDFINAPDIENGNIPDGIKILFMPFLMTVGANLAKGLINFVNRGGVLVGTAKCGMMDDNTWYNSKRPGAGLDTVFGLKETQVEVEDNILIMRKNDSTFHGFHHKVIMEKYPLTETIATFTDMSPAITLNRYGKGEAWYFATHIGMSWLEYKEKTLKNIIEHILKNAGVKRNSMLKIEDNENNFVVDLHTLVNDKERMYILINNNDIRLKFSVQIMECLKELTDLRTGIKLDLTYNKTESFFQSYIDKCDYAVFFGMTS